MSEFKAAESESVSVPQESLPPEPKRFSRRSVLRMHEPVASGQPLTGAVSFVAPSFEPFGAIGRLSAIGDTNGSTLVQLESEVNKLKQALRDYGVLSL